MSKGIVSWTLIQMLDKTKKVNNPLVGACVTCPNAQWRALLQSSYYKNDNKVYWCDSGKEEYKGETFYLRCFCTVSHEFIGDALEFCDGNPPETEPKLEDFINEKRR